MPVKASAHQPWTAYTRHPPGTPLRTWRPAVLERDARSPTTRSLTVPETSTSPASGERRDPRADVDREPGDVVRLHLDLAGVDARPDLEPELADRVADRERAADRPRRAVECREEPVAGRLDLVAAEPLELPPGHPVMLVEQRAASGRRRAPPRAASTPTMSVNRTVASTRVGLGAGRTPVTKSWISATIASWSPAQIRLSMPGSSTYRRARDVLREVTAVLDAEAARVAPVDDERRDADRRQDVADVALVDEANDRHGAARAGGLALVARPRPPQPFVVRDARGEQVDHQAATRARPRPRRAPGRAPRAARRSGSPARPGTARSNRRGRGWRRARDGPRRTSSP